MKAKSLIIILTLIANFSFGQEFTDLYGDYLGQTPPGDTAVVFAPGIVTTADREHSAPTFSPDGNEVYWTVQRSSGPSDPNTHWFVMGMRRINNRWTIPEKCDLIGDGPVFSEKGNRLYFGLGDDHFCYIERRGNNWSEPVRYTPKGMDTETSSSFGQLSVTENGTIYFTGISEGLGTENNRAIFRSKFINGEYDTPELLPSCINLIPYINWTPYISHDESYLIFSSERREQLGNGDLYISFRDTITDTWSEPVNMGEGVNSREQDRYPMVSPDGKYLFFTRPTPYPNHDIYWVSTNIIKKLKDEYEKNKCNPQ